MAGCVKCGAPCQGRFCQTHRIEASHEGLEADDLGWNRAKEIEDEEAED